MLVIWSAGETVRVPTKKYFRDSSSEGRATSKNGVILDFNVSVTEWQL